MRLFSLFFLFSFLFLCPGCGTAIGPEPALRAQGIFAQPKTDDDAFAKLSGRRDASEWVAWSCSDAELAGIVDLSIAGGLPSRGTDQFLGVVTALLRQYYDGKGSLVNGADVAKAQCRKTLERHLSRWINAHPSALELDNVSRALFAAPSCTVTRCVPVAERFPGLDTAGIGYVALFKEPEDGHPLSCDGYGSEPVVCGSLRRALSNEGERARFITALASHDAALTGRLVRMLAVDHQRGGTPGLVELVTELAPHPEHQQLALRAIAERFECEPIRPFILGGGKSWAAHAELRGVTLFMLAKYTLAQCQDDPAYATNGVAEDRYVKRLGAPFDTKTFGEMLDASPYAMSVGFRMWSYFHDDPTVSRIDVVLQHLGSFVDLSRGPQVCRRHVPCDRDYVHGALRAFIDDRRAQKDVKTLARLHAWLVATIPNDEVLRPELSDLVDRAAPSTRKP